jgi:hypothetical protein
MCAAASIEAGSSAAAERLAHSSAPDAAVLSLQWQLLQLSFMQLVLLVQQYYTQCLLLLLLNDSSRRLKKLIRKFAASEA